MPVNGKHILQKIPCPVLDRSWGRDRDWEIRVVEGLRRGSTVEVVASDYGPVLEGYYRANLELAEARSRRAARLTRAEVKAHTVETAKQRRMQEAVASAEARKVVQAKALERARQDAEWDKVEIERRQTIEKHRLEAQRFEEGRTILKSQWQCPCGAPAKIAKHGDDYRLFCDACGKSAVATHERVFAIVPR